MRFNLIIILFVLFKSGYADDFERQQIQDRIKPVGAVHLEEQSPAVKPAVEQEKKAAPVKELPGQATYEQYCAVCHRDGVAGAPKFQQADWEVRLGQKSLDELTASAIKGLNAMPAKGTCADCSETEIKNAIQYMLPKK